MLVLSLAYALLLAPSGALRWEEIAKGVERRPLPELSGEVLRFDLERFRVDVEVPGPDGARTAGALRKERGAAAVTNGGFFDERGRSLGLRIGQGRTLVKLRAHVDWGVLVVRGRRAVILHSRDYVPDPAIDAAVQVGPRLLVDGVPTRLKPQRARRTAVALDRTGRYLTLVVTRDDAEAGALARALAALELDSALLLDGGPSTQLSARAGQLALDVPGGYAVPDLLLLLPRPAGALRSR